jgi:hypothetical protein
VPRCQRDGFLRPYLRLSRPKSILFLSSCSSIVLTRLSGPRSRPTTSQKIWWRQESNPDLWICSQELWPLDQRGGQSNNRKSKKIIPKLYKSKLLLLNLKPYQYLLYFDGLKSITKIFNQCNWSPDSVEHASARILDANHSTGNYVEILCSSVC